ncbi:probable 2-oxoglutarate-dependent dioxygenase AOP1 [Humulus lupulus]|uniref:probable 2-oxoglutarate-dependent dioxygenase AOP1 n=1 Tax=Humulus lupulus TaxID=3486 RepID=UPI002B40DA86|nr:probable 2-oxoglutarate-dependent dioxygenase AOP1 [Humulus lupulus]
MGSERDDESKNMIPVIDFSDENLKPGSDSWGLACKRIHYGLEEYGCFEAKYDKVPIQLHNSLFLALKDLFDLPIETKMQKTSERPGFNYVGLSPTLPFYESLGFDHPTSFEEVESFTRVMWPQGNDYFRDSVRSFSKPMEDLYAMATRMVFESYGVLRLYESHMESIFHRLRLFKYRIPETNETMGVPNHTDKTFITILHQHEVEGLQVKTKDDQYIDIKPDPSSFLFIAADACMAWSNDRIRACEHRVMLSEFKPRYSLGFYSLVNGVMHVPEELIDENYPLRYKPIDHMNFIFHFNTDDALRNSACPIKTFCGV